MSIYHPTYKQISVKNKPSDIPMTHFKQIYEDNLFVDLFCENRKGLAPKWVKWVEGETIIIIIIPDLFLPAGKRHSCDDCTAV